MAYGTGGVMGGYDVIVVGARVAGASTALLLARAGLRVLVVDRAGLPSDTISSHQVQLPGVALLRRWGLLDRLVAAGTPLTPLVRFDSTGVVMTGRLPEYDGVSAMCSPRRTLLDAVLLDAARAAGALVRTGFRVEELLWSAGRVVGIRGREHGHQSADETATIVVGADGKHSFVAERVRAARYREHETRAFASYSYWAGVPLSSGELYQRPGRAVAAFPTNDNLVMVYTSAPLAEFPSARGDLEGHYLRTLDACGDLGERVRAGVRVERLRSTPDQPNTFRASHGPGWALVGDAGVVQDSISAHGIANALRDADLLATALIAGLSSRQRLDRALAGHRRARDSAIRASYDFTVRLAGFPAPSRGAQYLLAAIADRPAEVTRFLGAFAGVQSVDRYFGAVNVVRVLAASRLTRLGRRRLPQSDAG